VGTILIVSYSIDLAPAGNPHVSTHISWRSRSRSRSRRHLPSRFRPSVIYIHSPRAGPPTTASPPPRRPTEAHRLFSPRRGGPGGRGCGCPLCVPALKLCSGAAAAAALPRKPSPRLLITTDS